MKVILILLLFVHCICAGRIIGYLPAWTNDNNYDHTKEPLPTGQALQTAGYTSVIIAFGLFSTITPGAIVYDASYVSKINATYIKTLHDAKLEVLLSIGGAQTDIPNTSVEFDTVLQLGKSKYGSDYINTFVNTFITTVTNLSTTYGFDGIDIDIEHKIVVTNPSVTTFTNPPPDSDIGVLSTMLNKLYSTMGGKFLISLAPQSMNVEADWGWGTDSSAIYSSLIMQTYKSLSWVGVQVYQTGGCHGIDGNLYTNTPTSTNFSVAIAVDLLESWPQNTTDHFLPYISYLRPDQVVLGYLSSDANGAGDGQPVGNTTTIKNAIKCLQTGSAGCDTPGYRPPKAEGVIGGAFNWQIMWDQNNTFHFATDLKPCIINGNC